MDKIIDMDAHRRSREDQPDPEFVSRDFRTDRVDTMFVFIGHCEFDGETWSIELWARDIEEAQRKLAAVSGGKIDGQIMSSVPA